MDEERIGGEESVDENKREFVVMCYMDYYARFVQESEDGKKTSSYLKLSRFAWYVKCQDRGHTERTCFLD